jgi:hypothetical protein
MAAAAFQAALDQVNASLRRNALVPAETLLPSRKHAMTNPAISGMRRYKGPETAFVENSIDGHE